MRKFFLAMFLVACSMTLAAQQTLNNDAVIKLVKAGLSDDLIVTTINSSPGLYTTTTDALIAFKQAGASDRVISAIIAKASAPPAQAKDESQNSASQPAAAPQPLFHSTDGKIRVYITDHPIFESNGLAKAAGNRHGGAAAATSHTQAGDDPRTVEVQADIVKVCPANIVASNNPDRSDYVLVFRRRGGERSSFFAMGGLTGLALSAAAKVDGASLFENNGDMIYATKQNSVEKAIKDICSHIPQIANPQAASNPSAK
jgi:hypothetical protein